MTGRPGGLLSEYRHQTREPHPAHVESTLLDHPRAIGSQDAAERRHGHIGTVFRKQAVEAQAPVALAATAINVEMGEALRDLAQEDDAGWHGDWCPWRRWRWGLPRWVPLGQGRTKSRPRRTGPCRQVVAASSNGRVGRLGLSLRFQNTCWSALEHCAVGSQLPKLRPGQRSRLGSDFLSAWSSPVKSRRRPCISGRTRPGETRTKLTAACEGRPVLRSVLVPPIPTAFAPFSSMSAGLALNLGDVLAAMGAESLASNPNAPIFDPEGRWQIMRVLCSTGPLVRHI